MARVLRLLAGLAIGLLAVALAFQRVHDPDLPWHLRAGEEILAHASVPTTDTWSVLSLGRPWLDIHWAAQVVLALTYRAGGFVLLQGLAAALVLGALGVAVSAAGGRLSLLALPMATVALLASQQRFDPRPDLVALVFPAAFLLLLDRISRVAGHGVPPYLMLAALAAAEAAWTNLHGSYVLGPMLVLAYLGGALLGGASRPIRRALLMALAAVTVATLLNPRGALAWELFTPYVRAIGARFGVATAAAPRIQEWLPTLSVDAAPYMVGILRPYELLLLLAVVALLAARPEDLARAAVLLFFGVLSVLAIRNVAPFAFVALAVVPSCLDRALGRLPARVRRLAVPLVPLLTLLVTFAYAGAFFTNHIFITRLQAGGVGPGPDRDLYPMGACDYIRDAGIAGQVFNSYAAGGYYIWRFAPGKTALVDGRLDLLAPAELDRFVNAMRNPALFEEMARANRVTHVLLAYAGADAGTLVRYLESPDTSGWRRAFADGAAAVYLRADVAATAARGVPSPPSSAHPADTAALRLLAPLLDRQRKFPTAALNLAYLAEAGHDLGRAAELYREALEILPEARHARGRLAEIELRRGAIERAREELERLEAEDPDDPALAPLRSAIEAAARSVR